MTIFASVRVQKIKTMAQLVGANIHALREDKTSISRIRDGAVPGECLAASISKEGDQRNVVEAFKAFKLETGAKERAGAPIALHLLCVVSPDWIKEAGDLHDRNNPRNVQLMQSATDWVETWAGKNSAINVRLDLDEEGGGVVDVFVTPTRESRGKSVISTSKAVKEVQAKHGDKYEYSSLQTDWAEYAKKHLDQRIERGRPVDETGREHVNADVFKEYAEKAVVAEKSKVKAELQKAEILTDVLLEQNVVRAAELKEREDALKREIEAFQALQEKTKVENDEAAKQQKMQSSRSASANNYRNGSKKERQARLKKAKGRKREAKLSDNEMLIKRREWAVERREQQAKEKEQENIKVAQRLNLEKIKLSQREEMAAGLESRLSSFSAKLKIQKEDADRREREIQVGEDRNKFQIIHLDKREKRLKICQSTADELLVSLDKKLKAVASREQDVEKNERYSTDRQQRLNLREGRLDERENALTARERSVASQIENHQSARRVIDFASEFSSTLPKGLNFESVIRNVSQRYDFSRVKPESRNLAISFFAMMEKSAKEIDRMQGRGAPVQGVPRSVSNKGVER